MECGMTSKSYILCVSPFLAWRALFILVNFIRMFSIDLDVHPVCIHTHTHCTPRTNTISFELEVLILAIKRRARACSTAPCPSQAGSVFAGPPPPLLVFNPAQPAQHKTKRHSKSKSTQ